MLYRESSNKEMLTILCASQQRSQLASLTVNSTRSNATLYLVVFQTLSQLFSLTCTAYFLDLWVALLHNQAVGLAAEAAHHLQPSLHLRQDVAIVHRVDYCAAPR